MPIVPVYILIYFLYYFILPTAEWLILNYNPIFGSEAIYNYEVLELEGM
jgi:hypothetical protein